MNNGEKVKLGKVEQKMDDFYVNNESEHSAIRRAIRDLKENDLAHIIKKIDGLGDRYAAKWVEKIVYGGLAGGSLYFIYKLIDLLEK